MPPSAYARFVEDGGAETLRRPTAICAFGGWVDAGLGGTGAVRYLVESLGARKVAELDGEEFYSFTDTRPLTSVVGPGERAVHWPRAEFYSARLPDDAPSDLLLLVAPEPNLKWRTFAGALLDVLRQLHVASVVSLGSIFGMVHHRGTVPLTGWATDPALRTVLQRHQITFTNYEGPTGFVTVLLAEAQARGLPAAAILGFSPNYIQGVPNPRTSLALLKAVAAVQALPLQLADLERTARALSRQVDRLLGDQPELREQVERMLRLASVAEPPEEEIHEASLDDAPPGELPNPQALVSDLENFLKQIREQDRGPSDSSAGL